MKRNLIMEIEKKISSYGGFRARSYEKYKEVMEVYINECHQKLFEYYSNDRFAKQNMITWRKKRMVIQQFLSDLFKPSDEEVKSKKYRPIIYAIGDVNFKSTGKGEKGGAPIAKIGIELKSKIKQMSREGRQDPR